MVSQYVSQISAHVDAPLCDISSFHTISDKKGEKHEILTNHRLNIHSSNTIGAYLKWSNVICKSSYFFKKNLQLDFFNNSVLKKYI